MSLSPSYRDRAALPHQPRPPAHWPEDCAEIVSHAWLRVWRCPTCKQEWINARRDVQNVVGLCCYGDGTFFVHEEPTA